MVDKSKRYFMYFLIISILCIFYNGLLFSVCNAHEEHDLAKLNNQPGQNREVSQNIPGKDSLNNKSDLKVSSQPTSTEGLTVEKVEKKEEPADPTKNYKLVGIYLINKQPRALIKNLNTPDEPAKEYQEGDFIDELQTISVSKISFIPTSRIELLDQGGLNYLIKIQTADSKTPPATTKSTFSTKSAPSYFSGASGKAKARKSPQPVQETTSPPADANKPDGSAQAAVATGSETSAASKPQADSVAPPAQSPPVQAATGQSVQSAVTGALQSGASGTATTQKTAGDASKTTGTTDSFDANRPANPFGQ